VRRACKQRIALNVDIASAHLPVWRHDIVHPLVRHFTPTARPLHPTDRPRHGHTHDHNLAKYSRARPPPRRAPRPSTSAAATDASRRPAGGYIRAPWDRRMRCTLDRPNCIGNTNTEIYCTVRDRLEPWLDDSSGRRIMLDEFIVRSLHRNGRSRDKTNAFAPKGRRVSWPFTVCRASTWALNIWVVLT